MMPRPRKLPCAFLTAALAAFVFASRPATAFDLVDQESFPGETTGTNAKLISVAQSFTPTFSTLAFVNVKLSCCGASDPGPALVRLDIRSGGIAGPIIGSSSSLSLPDGSGRAMRQFEISPPLVLTPGATYVFEIVFISGGQFGVTSGSFPDYPGGVKFNDGVTTGNGDVVFQTGVFTDEPPQMSGDPGPVEYSNDVDEQALVGGGQGPADPGQVLHAEPPDGAADSLPQDATDFVPGIESGTEPDAQVDALAYGLDHLYSEVVANTADLVVSFAGDEYLGGGAVSEVATLVERPSGTTLVHYTHDDLDAADSSNGAIDDVDGIELWGPLASDDAFYYSLVGDVGAGESIYVYSAGTSNPFVSHSTIVNAVVTLGYTGDASDVDLDALMVRNLASREEFEAGDEILFSIRAVPQANFDGGEIIRLPAGGAASFLSHGGHAWDSAFATAATFESTSEDVDALEATPSPSEVPSLTGRLKGVLAALFVALSLVTMRRAPAAYG